MFENETTEYALLRMAGIVQFVMSEMEASGEVITRDSLHNAVKDLIEKNEKLDAA
jgi:hypothetical protein